MTLSRHRGERGDTRPTVTPLLMRGNARPLSHTTHQYRRETRQLPPHRGRANGTPEAGSGQRLPCPPRSGAVCAGCLSGASLLPDTGLAAWGGPGGVCPPCQVSSQLGPHALASSQSLLANGVSRAAGLSVASAVRVCPSAGEPAGLRTRRRAAVPARPHPAGQGAPAGARGCGGRCRRPCPAASGPERICPGGAGGPGGSGNLRRGPRWPGPQGATCSPGGQPPAPGHGGRRRSR